MSVKDVIKKSILESDMFNQAITGSTIFSIGVNLLVATVMGILIYFVYKKLYEGVVYSRNFAITLIGMTILTCMVTLAISTNIVISLGMVGALSIVRYRTAVKEPLDIMYLFWAITTGITVGASMYILALGAAVVVFFVLLIMHKKGDSRQIYLYILHFEGSKVYEDIIRNVRKNTYLVRSKIIRGEDWEVTLEIRPQRGQQDLAERLAGINGMTNVTALQYNGEYHG